MTYADPPLLSVVMPVFKEGDSVEPVLRALAASRYQSASSFHTKRRADSAYSFSRRPA